MASADTAEAPARAEPVKRKPPTPGAQKKKLTIGEAVEQYAETSRAIAGLEMLQSEAKAAIVAHGERTGKRTFLDRVAMVRSGGSLRMDQAAVREVIPAERFVEGDLMKRDRLGWQLKLLK